MDLYLHSSNTYSWSGAQLRNTGTTLPLQPWTRETALTHPIHSQFQVMDYKVIPIHTDNIA